MTTRRHSDDTIFSMRSNALEMSGLVIDDLDESETVSLLDTRLSEGRGGWIVTANSDIARICRQRPEIRQVVREADLVVADGMPLIWASKIVGAPLRARVCGSDLVWSIAQRAAGSGHSLFLLGGGHPGTAAAAGRLLEKQFAGLKVAGTYFPPFGFEHDEAEMTSLRRTLQEADPDIIYVALGFPKAELLIHRLRESHPKTWWIGIGISLSFIAGEVRRAPRWMQVAGLEWLHRLIQEPRRLFVRYIWHDIPFVIGLLAKSAWQRLRGKRPKKRAHGI